MKKTNDVHYEANRLADAFLSTGKVDSLSKAQEFLAKVKGFKNWHELQQNLKQTQNINYSLDINMSERAQFFLQNLPIEVINCQTIVVPARNEEVNSKEYVISTPKEPLKKVRKIFQKTNTLTSTTITSQDFPILALGSCGAGMSEAFQGIKKQIISEGSGFIDINGTGCNTSYVKAFSMAQSIKREKDLLFINFMTGSRENIDSGKVTHKINPLEHFLLNENYFNNYFGKEFSKLLYPALKSYEAKNQRVKMNSIQTFLTLPQLMLMANSDEWNNRKETSEYLQSIGINPLGENSDEEILDAMEVHTVKTARTYQQISNIANPSFCAFSDEPEINFVDIISQRKICIISMPCLERSVDELWCIKEIINQMLLAADSVVGHQKCFLFFNETGEKVETKSLSLHLAKDWIQQQEILRNPKNPENLVNPDSAFYKSIFFFRQEYPRCELFEKMIQDNWNNRQFLKEIQENPIKKFQEGHAFIIKNYNFHSEIKKIVFDYQQIKHSSNIYLNRIEK